MALFLSLSMITRLTIWRKCVTKCLVGPVLLQISLGKEHTLQEMTQRASLVKWNTCFATANKKNGVQTSFRELKRWILSIKILIMILNHGQVIIHFHQVHQHTKEWFMQFSSHSLGKWSTLQMDGAGPLSKLKCLILCVNGVNMN